MWTEHSTLNIALACLIGVVSVARTARLITYDDFPPMLWLRLKILSRVGDDSAWKKLIECQFCLAPWLAMGMVGWAWASDLHWTWWIINGAWAGAYLAAILVSYDQPE